MLRKGLIQVTKTNHKPNDLQYTIGRESNNGTSNSENHAHKNTSNDNINKDKTITSNMDDGGGLCFRYFPSFFGTAFH